MNTDCRRLEGKVAIVTGSARGLGFAIALVRRVGALVVGDPAREEVTVGPLINGAAVEALESRVDEAVAAGATVLATADLGSVPEGGHFGVPTLLAADDVRAAVNQEETFGPLVTLIRATTVDEAVEVANATPFGLSAGVHGADVARASAVASRIRAGLQRVNLPTSGVDFYAPFGGEGASSFGPREQGRASREFFTSSRTMTIASTRVPRG
jgi:aldehyde dehydrogenase (NAD+)